MDQLTPKQIKFLKQNSHLLVLEQVKLYRAEYGVSLYSANHVVNYFLRTKTEIIVIDEIQDQIDKLTTLSTVGDIKVILDDMLKLIKKQILPYE